LHGSTSSKTAPNGRANRRPSGRPSSRRPASSPAPPGANIAELLAYERCSQAVLDFLATTDVGRTAGLPVANEEDDAASDASEWKARERAEWDWEQAGGGVLRGISFFLHYL